jgi:hypothetical protein
LYSTRAAKLWCQAEGVEFIDNRLTRLPENLRPLVTAARRAGSPVVRSIGAFESGQNLHEVAAYEESIDLPKLLQYAKWQKEWDARLRRQQSWS